MRVLKLFVLSVIFFSLAKARTVEVWVERGHKSFYRAGENVRVHVVSKVSGYLYLYSITPGGKAKLIFPVGDPVYIHGGVHYVLPDDFYYDIDWVCSYEPGIEYIYAIVVPYPIYDIPYDCFEPLPPDYAYPYDDIGIKVVFRFRPPHWFPRVYFSAWTAYYVIPRYYVYRPAPWYCYDCHTPRVFVSIYIDFCPLYEIRVYNYRYVCVPRYIKYVHKRYRYRVRTYKIERTVTPEKRVRLRKLEKETIKKVRMRGIEPGKSVDDILVKKTRIRYEKDEKITKYENRKLEKEKIGYKDTGKRKKITKKEKKYESKRTKDKDIREKQKRDEQGERYKRYKRETLKKSDEKRYYGENKKVVENKKREKRAIKDSKSLKKRGNLSQNRRTYRRSR